SEPAAEAAGLIETIARLADDALALAGATEPLDRHAVRVDSAFLGAGYGLPTPETVTAIRQLASLEGLLLDPVYSGKAMSGLLGKIRDGQFDGVSDVVFLHTGGVASLPVYADALLTPNDTGAELG
ncbi:MAG TPA: pyridoxal-phosphate dependent enzyme, partial [Pseudomonadales bacterium]